jgi:hypothetical protein
MHALLRTLIKKINIVLIYSACKKTHYFFESGAKKASGSRLAHFESQEFTVVNDCFQIKCNEAIGLYRQTLINLKAV